MFAYLLLILVLWLQGKTIKNRKLFLFIAFLEMTFVSGLRVQVLGIGADTEYYCNHYVELSSYKFEYLFQSFYFEMGFDVFCKCLSFISKNPQFLIFATQALMNGLVVRFVARNTHNCWLGVFLYITLMFFFGAMNTMRFCLACSILLQATDFIIERRFVRFSMIVIVASLFHFSALMFFGLYFLYAIRPTKRNLFYLTIPFILALVLFYALFNTLIQINPRYSSYDSGNGEFYQSSVANILILLVNLLFLIFISIKNNRQVHNLCGRDKLFFLCIFLSVCFSAMAIKVMMITRFVTMFSMMEIVAVPNVLNSIRNIKSRRMWTDIIILGTLSQVITILALRPEWYQVTPYKNWLFAMMFG